MEGTTLTDRGSADKPWTQCLCYHRLTIPVESSKARKLAAETPGGLWCVARVPGSGRGRHWLNGGTLAPGNREDGQRIPAWSREGAALYTAEIASAIMLRLEDEYPGLETYRMF